MCFNCLSQQSKATLGNKQRFQQVFSDVPESEEGEAYEEAEGAAQVWDEGDEGVGVELPENKGDERVGVELPADGCGYRAKDKVESVVTDWLGLSGPGLLRVKISGTREAAVSTQQKLFSTGQRPEEGELFFPCLDD